MFIGLCSMNKLRPPVLNWAVLLFLRLSTSTKAIKNQSPAYLVALKECRGIGLFRVLLNRNFQPIYPDHLLYRLLLLRDLLDIL